jgi:glutamine synthetase type III
LRKAFAFVLICLLTLLSTNVNSQTRRRNTAKRRTSATSAATEKSAADIKAGAAEVSTQIKTLTQFIYLLGGVVKGIEAVDQAVGKNEASPAAKEQNERNKTRVRDSLRSVREGLDKLESDFRFHPTLKTYFPYLSGVAHTAEAAENQAAANRFDEAGRSLLKAVGQLADALAAMR